MKEPIIKVLEHTMKYGLLFWLILGVIYVVLFGMMGIFEDDFGRTVSLVLGFVYVAFGIYCTFVFSYKKENIILGYAFIIYKIENADSLVKIKTMYVDDFCVDENYKHQGIGTKLFDFLKDEAKKQNCYNITLNVYNFNKSAKAFYEKQQLKELKTYMELIVK